MTFIIKQYKNFNKNNYNSFILGGDIGGTNTNLGIFGIKNNVSALLLSFHFKSKELKGLHYAVNEALDYFQKNFKIKIMNSCFAVAGVLAPNKESAQMTNSKWNVSKKILSKKSILKKIILINDFEAVGYGINMLARKDIIQIKKAKKIPKAQILVIGAGTGLGKTTLVYNERDKSYAPLPSEAGHSDFPAQSKKEFGLVNSIKKRMKAKANVSYEMVLSGQGLVNIYLYLRTAEKFKETIYTKEIDNSKNQPELISAYKQIDETCKKTFEIFKNIFAKFAGNFAVDALAYSGLYIAGGIAVKNIEMFDNTFINIFEKNYKVAYVLKRIPIYLIKNYNVGLLGAGFVGAKFLSE